MKSAPIPDNEQARLAALHRYRILDTEFEEGFDDFTKLASQIAGTPIALISLVDETRQWFKSRSGLEALQTPRDISFCGHAVDGHEVFEVPDTLEDERFFDNPLVTGEPLIRSYAGAPLLAKDGQAIGTLCVLDRVPRTLSVAQKSAMQALARQVMRQMEMRLLIFKEQELNQEILRQATFQKVLSDNVVVAMMSATTDGLITSFNPAAERLLGYDALEIVGKKFLGFFHVSEELQARAQELSADLGRSVEPQDSLFTLPLAGSSEIREWRYRRQNGSVIAVKVAVAPISQPNRTVTGLIVFAWDITERQKAQQEILRLNADLDLSASARTAELQRTADDLQGLSHFMAHDLRQPVISVAGFSDLLKKSALGESERHYVERISSGINQISARVDALLYFANLLGRPLQRKNVNLAELARGHLDVLKSSDPQRRVVADIPAEIMVNGDQYLLERVVLELLNNAWRASSTQDTTRISVGSRMEDTGKTTYRIQDNGEGFDVAYVNQLFEPFQKLKGSQDYDRRGMGLARVKRIIAKHGGRIWTESHVGKGAVIFFTLGAS